MKLGITIYALNKQILTDFYQQAFDFDLLDHDSTYSRLLKDSTELIILQSPEEFQAATSETLKPRETTPIKPTFFIDQNISDFRDKVSQLNGSVYKEKPWQFHGYKVCDGHDPEGNIFQVRF
jgi:predicted enzyme related to lactoylglutathione lyase